MTKLESAEKVVSLYKQEILKQSKSCSNYYILSNGAKQDIIRIHPYGLERFGEVRADRYLYSLFICIKKLPERPYSFESVDYIRKDY
jgi:plasmid stabilization system protein ParE